MANSGLTSVEKSLLNVIAFLITAMLIGSCAGPAQEIATDTHKFPKEKEHEHQISGNTFTDKTYNYRVTVPNSNWTIKASDQPLGDALQIATAERKGYNGFFTVIAVSKYNQENLEQFAGVGTYNPKISKYTYMAGKPAFYASKIVSQGGFELQTLIYKFVNNGIGYVFSVAYLSQWAGDETLLMEIDQFINSFTFLSEKDTQGKTQISIGGRIGKEKLSNVAVLTMVDLQSDKPSNKTAVLTSELQTLLTKTGKFECVDRKNIKKVVQEQVFQQSGMISSDSAIKLGKLIGAKYLVSSNLGQLGETSVVYIQITEVESGKILKTASSRCRKCNDDMLLDTISNLVSSFIF